MALVTVPIYPTRNLATEVDPGARSIVAGTGVSFVVNADGSITINSTGLGGTVTSVGATGSTGLTVGGSPITTSGVLTFTLSANLQGWSGIAPSTLGNYVLKAGDTMTGILNMTNAGGNAEVTFAKSGLSGVYGTNGAALFLGTRSAHNIDIYSNNLLRGTVDSAGVFQWQDSAQFNAAGTAGGVVVKTFPGSSAYTGWHHASHTGNAYMIISNGTDTYVSTSLAGAVGLRPAANSTTGQLLVTTAGAAVNGTISDVYSDTRQLGAIIAMSSNLNCQNVYSGRQVVKNVGTAGLQFILQPNATVATTVGIIVTITNDGSTANNMTIVRGAGVELWRNGTNANVTLTPGSSITVSKVATDRWQA